MKENFSLLSGFLICALYVFIIFIAAHYYPIYLSMGESFYLFAAFSLLLNSVFIISFIAIALMSRFRKTSFVVLLVAGIAMLPFSTLMLYGIARRNAQLRFASLTQWHGSVNDPHISASLPACSKNALVTGSTLFAFGLVSLIYPHSFLAYFAAPIGFIILLNVYRLRNAYRIALWENDLLLTPAFFADTYCIALSECRFRLWFNDQLNITINDTVTITLASKGMSKGEFLASVIAICEKAGIDNLRDIKVNDIPDD